MLRCEEITDDGLEALGVGFTSSLGSLKQLTLKFGGYNKKSPFIRFVKFVVLDAAKLHMKALEPFCLKVQGSLNACKDLSLISESNDLLIALVSDLLL